MSSELEDRHKLILSDGTKYIELEVDGDSAVKLRSDLLYAKRHMLAIEQMLPASVKHHQLDDGVDKLDYFLLVNGAEKTAVPDADNGDDDYVPEETFAWTNKATTLLCKLRSEMNQMFHGGPRSMKIGLWNKCAKTMRQNGFPNVTGELCRRKWQNMMMTYKRILEAGHASRSSWEFFSLVHGVMQHQASNDPASNLVVSTISEPRKRKRYTIPSDSSPAHNGDLFDIPTSANVDTGNDTDYGGHRERKSKSRSTDNFLKMVLNLRRDELEFHQRESDRRWEERRQRRRDRLKYQEEKLKAVQTLTEVLQKLIEK